MRSISLLMAAAVLASCNPGHRVEFIDAMGKKAMTGTAVYDPGLRNVRIEVSGEAGSCSGVIDDWWKNATTTFLVKCSDGSAGTGTIWRTGEIVVEGAGTVSLNDGRRYDFVLKLNT